MPRKNTIPTPRKKPKKEAPDLRGINSVTSPKSVLAVEREAEAIQLRISGATFEEIGKALNVTTEGARQALIRALEKTQEETKAGAEYLRELERLRLERMVMSAMPQALGGVLDAISQVRQLSESIRRLLGLDLASARISFISPLALTQGVEDQLTRVYGPTTPS